MDGAFRVIGAGTRLRYQLVGLDIGWSEGRLPKW